MNDERKTLKIHPDLHKELKLHSAGTGLSIQAVLEVAVMVVTRLSYNDMRKITFDYYNDKSMKYLDNILKPANKKIGKPKTKKS